MIVRPVSTGHFDLKVLYVFVGGRNETWYIYSLGSPASSIVSGN